MVKRRRPPIGGLIVAFVFAGAVVSFGVAIIASWLGLPGWAVWVAVLAGLAVLAWPIFSMRGDGADDDGTGRMSG